MIYMVISKNMHTGMQETEYFDSYEDARKCAAMFADRPKSRKNVIVRDSNGIRCDYSGQKRDYAFERKMWNERHI